MKREFVADLVVPSTGKTYGEMAIPQITEAYQRQAPPPLVPVSARQVNELQERTES